MADLDYQLIVPAESDHNNLPLVLATREMSTWAMESKMGAYTYLGELGPLREKLNYQPDSCL